MGFMTLDDFRTDLQSALGDRGLGNPKLDRWVNFAYLDLAGAISFESLEDDITRSTVAANRAVAAPGNTLAIKVVRDTTNDRLLSWIPKPEYFRRSASASGQPTHWTRHGEEILLHPIPDDVFSLDIFYQTMPDRLTSPADTTILPDTWDVAIHLLSVYHGLQATGEEQRASAWWARAVNYIQTRLSEDLLQATSSGLGLSLPPIRQLDIRPFVGQLGQGQEG
jgi:hypothetical protein